MKFTSTAFEHETSIPSKYTCDGENVSPPLAISEIPEGVASLALTMHDPDVPRQVREDGNWDHWLAWNIPAEITEIAEAQEPQGEAGRNTGGKFGYGGPCPPDREHRYFFRVYALDSRLELPQEATRADLEQAMEGHILARAELMGKYVRKETK